MESINTRLFDLIFSLSHKNALVDAMGVFAADYLPYILVLFFLWFALAQKTWRKRLFCFSEAVLAVLVSRGILTELIRHFYMHPRPFEVLGFSPLVPESGNSFPSGHAMWFFALSMTLFFYNRRWGIWFFILSIINGIARVYVGVHWPFDIIGGTIMGILVAWIIHATLKKHFNELFAMHEEHKLPGATG